MEKFLFGLSIETIIIFVLAAIVIIILLARKSSGGAIAMAASIPIFWLFSKKLGGSKDELVQIQLEYDRKLKELKSEFNTKIESIKNEVRQDLQVSRRRSIQIEHDIETVDSDSKTVIDKATPDELEELAKGLLMIHKKGNEE